MITEYLGFYHEESFNLRFYRKMLGFAVIWTFKVTYILRKTTYLYRGVRLPSSGFKEIYL